MREYFFKDLTSLGSRLLPSQILSLNNSLTLKADKAYSSNSYVYSLQGPQGLSGTFATSVLEQNAISCEPLKTHLVTSNPFRVRNGLGVSLNV